jgi:hypothetical protein
VRIAQEGWRHPRGSLCALLTALFPISDGLPLRFASQGPNSVAAVFPLRNR